MKVLSSLRVWLGVFLCTYFTMYIIPFPLEWIPFQLGSLIENQIDDFWNWVVPFFAEQVFAFEGGMRIRTNGSGDTTYHYYKLATQLLIAFPLSFLIFLLLKQKDWIRRLWPYLQVYFRYFLSITLLSYGFAKVIPNQFLGPSLTDLFRPIGEQSPMGLLWRFMGHSVPYMIFTGLMEVITGILLLNRRTTKLGGLLGFGVMLNILLLNLFYDVPVKLYSFHLLLLILVILQPYYQSLWRFFIQNTPTAPDRFLPYFRNKKVRYFGWIIKGFFVLVVPFIILSNNINGAKSYGRKAKLPPLYGIYEVESFVKNGDSLPALSSDRQRWKRFVVDKFNVSIQRMNDKIKYARQEIDTTQLTINIKPYQESESYQLKYSLQDSILILMGHKGKDTVRIRLRQKNQNEFYLMNRGFHWINEYPNNR